MDAIEVIESIRDDFALLRDAAGLDSILRHLEAAERHFLQGRSDADDTRFADVIYRCNQVAEGVLREAYEVFSEKSAANLPTYKIEKYCETEGKFSSRIVDYFERYRIRWRNPSTHNHREDFGEQEAFLALMTVTAFCFVAFNEMLQTLSARSVLKMEFADADTEKTIREILRELTEFVPKMFARYSTGDDSPRVAESRILGALEGFFNAQWHVVSVDRNPTIKDEHGTGAADLLVTTSDTRLVVELRRIGTRDDLKRLREARAMLLRFAKNAEANHAVLVVWPRNMQEVSPYSLTMNEEDGCQFWLVYQAEV